MILHRKTDKDLTFCLFVTELCICFCCAGLYYAIVSNALWAIILIGVLLINSLVAWVFTLVAYAKDKEEIDDVNSK